MENTTTIFLWLLPIPAYLLGSIPSGILIARRFAAVDIRKEGSGNIGATNVMRLAGVLPGLLTLAADMLKGALPVILAQILTPAAEPNCALYVSAVALAAVCGHMFPFHSGFRGGKGVATTAGVFLAVSPPAVLIAAAGFALAAGVSRRVSVGSLTSAAVLIPATLWATRSLHLTLCALLAALLIAFCHRGNIVRLIRGSEPPFHAGKPK